MTTPLKNSQPHPHWIFIGASAGGLDAIKTFLTHFTSFDGNYLVIAQHLDPKHPTILRDLLARITDTPIVLVTEDTVAEPGNIYIISPGHNAKIQHKKIELSPAAEIGPKPSIDLLLKSAAASLGEQAIAIILSGTGSDGAQGVVDIKASNGLTFVQDSDTAKYSGMPLSAINTGAVDLVLPPEKIAQQITYFIENSQLQTETITLDSANAKLERIFNVLMNKTGYDFSGYKHKTVNRRIARRMVVNKTDSLDDYIVLLEASSNEVDQLYKDLLISVTDFFRDREHFRALEKVIDERIKNSANQDSMRVWVPGCANGQEAFSIAFLIYQSSIKYNKDINFQVFATDIDENALNMGRRAYYSISQVDNVPSELLERFFTEKNGHYLVAKKIRERVLFAKHNLVMDPPFSKVDIISCRNLLIYFAPNLQKEIFHTFHFSLKSDGILFLGKSESPVNISPELFEMHIKRAPIFMRKKIDLTDVNDQLKSANNFARQKLNAPKPNPIIASKNPSGAAKESLENQMLETLIPASIIVDSSGSIIHLKGKVNEFLSFPQGKINMNILTLIRDDLKVDLRVLLSKAEKDGQASSPVIFSDDAMNQESLMIVINRLSSSEGTTNFFAIGFLPVPFNNLFSHTPDSSQDDSSEQNVNQFLRQEVENFKERLQTTVEELELTNEELQSTNEELQSANEELQSANEELQTSNEELQSTNQELTTVNQELEIKSYELEQVNQDIESMLQNMNEAVIMIDNRLRLLRWTSVAEQLLHLDIAHTNQTITTIGLPVDIPELRQNILHVIETGDTQSVRVRNQEQVYNLRLQPHYGEGDTLSGVLMFFDEPQSEAKRKGIHVDCHRNFELIGDMIQQGLIVIDCEGAITYLNQAGSEIIGYPLEDIHFKSIDTIFPNILSSEFIHTLKSEKTQTFGRWQEYSIERNDHSRVLCEFRFEKTWVNSERHYLAFLRLK